MTQEREAAAELESDHHDAAELEPEPEGEGEGEELTTPVKTGLAFSFGKESPLFKIAEEIQDEEKVLFEGKTAEVMTSLMPEILAEATTFLGNLDTAARLQFSQEQVLYYIGAWRQPSAASPLATEYISLSTFHISTTTTRLN